jgi:hypothetical protein
MLTTLLSSLQSTSFFSKGFWLGSMLPVVVFVAVFAGMCANYYPESLLYLHRLDTLPAQGIVASAIAICLLLAAYLLAAAAPTLLQLLEGHRLPSPPRLLLHSRQWARLLALRKEWMNSLYEADAFLTQINDEVNGWEATLARAREKGNHSKTLTINIWNLYFLKATFSVRLRVRCGTEISSKLMRRAVDEIKTLLEQTPTESKTLNKTDQKLARQLDMSCIMLREAIWTGRDRWLKSKDDLFNVIQGAYPPIILDPSLPSTLNVLAPTSFGNVGATSRSYALNTYGLDLSIFWNRLQKLVQADKFYDTLQDAKIQVDAFVAMFWLTWLFVAIWSLALVFDVGSPFGFLKVTTVGPVVALSFYWTACRSYVNFADLLRTSVDLFRFSLLKSLDLPLPQTISEEKRLWLSLGNAMGYVQEIPITYKHP